MLPQSNQQVKNAKGKLDILFANAGGGAFLPLEQVTEEHFDKFFEINVKGTLFTVQKALSLMSSGSSIVLNGSIAASKGLPAFGVYSEVIATWRTSCPRLTIWEDAVDGGYVARESVAGFGVIITVTADGEKLLHNNGRIG